MYDIVYFVKESLFPNEELRYSLRSLRNFPHAKVWFYGGCPKGLNPDYHVHVLQDKENKWKNVNMMLRMACANDKITKKFWLFNDDFFIMEKINEPKNYYRGDFYKRIVDLENKYNGITPYSKMLRETAKELESLGVGSKDYTLHIPMLVNKKKALELFELVNGGSFRTIYGNYFNIANEQMNDCKISSIEKKWKGGSYLSTTEESFTGNVGKQIRNMFPDKCQYEK